MTYQSCYDDNSVGTVAQDAADTMDAEVMVVDPLPPDVFDAGDTNDTEVMVVDPLPPDTVEDTDEMVVDPLPPDTAEDTMVVDPPPPDTSEDVMVVDPSPEDVTEDTMVVDPPPEDVSEDTMVVDPLPPDVSPGNPDVGMAPALPPNPRDLPLDRSFRVFLEASVGHQGEIHLQARVSGNDDARLRWYVSGGSLFARGREAIFTPASKTSAFVMVSAQTEKGLLDTARYLIEAGEVEDEV